jgi:2-phosphosulfolactate phosphatase
LKHDFQDIDLRKSLSLSFCQKHRISLLYSHFFFEKRDMKQIEICLTPELIPLYSVSDKVVVIVDILRATSCMVAGMGSGVKSIVPVASLDECLALKAQGYITAGERDGKKVEGFDIGNSPFSFMDEAYQGQSIAMTTTNGTQAIVRSRNASSIVIGAFLNINAIAKHLRKQEQDVLIVCAGWKGRFNLEDTLFAGALSDILKDDFDTQDDAVIAARLLFQRSSDNMAELLRESSHFRRLSRLGIVDDIVFALQFDRFNVVPFMEGRHIIVA